MGFPVSPGDLVLITCPRDKRYYGLGIFLGTTFTWKKTYEFLWQGRIAEFDLPHWEFEVVSESR